MAHPIMPFITERLWSAINGEKEFLMNQIYEKHDFIPKFNNSQLNIKNLTEIISAVRNLRSELNIAYKNLIDINFSNSSADFIIFLNGYENELKRLLKLDKLSYDS